jgi:hypothetical protein
VYPAGGRVQSCEQLIGRIHRLARQLIEERGLTGVGISHDRDGQHIGPLTRTPLHLTLLTHLRELLFEHLDPFAEQPAVRFELRLTGPA